MINPARGSACGVSRGATVRATVALAIAGLALYGCGSSHPQPTPAAPAAARCLSSLDGTTAAAVAGRNAAFVAAARAERRAWNDLDAAQRAKLVGHCVATGGAPHVAP